ncbi:MAG: hypothetical protein K2X68_12940 [Novosphingobium sp.]|nr:hypothetical protein [Novosphingobium sp.]
MPMATHFCKARGDLFRKALWACLALAFWVGAANGQAPSSTGPQFQGAQIHCPDGSIRPWQGDPPSDLIAASACSVAADVAVERHRRAQLEWDKKNNDAKLQAALHGEHGVWEGLKASWEARSPDYLLRLPVVWIAMTLLLLFGVGQLIGRK